MKKSEVACALFAFKLLFGDHSHFLLVVEICISRKWCWVSGGLAGSISVQFCNNSECWLFLELWDARITIESQANMWCKYLIKYLDWTVWLWCTNKFLLQNCAIHWVHNLEVDSARFMLIFKFQGVDIFDLTKGIQCMELQLHHELLVVTGWGSCTPTKVIFTWATQFNLSFFTNKVSCFVHLRERLWSRWDKLDDCIFFVFFEMVRFLAGQPEILLETRTWFHASNAIFIMRGMC